LVPDQVPVVELSDDPSIRVPAMLGRPVLDGRRAPIRLVAAEIADVEPALLVAVTTTRSVEPTSAETSERAEPTAPEISLQDAPALLQSCQG
jgi:hypothetical protein